MSDPGDSTVTPEAAFLGGTWLAGDVVEDAGDWRAIPNAQQLAGDALNALSRHPEFADEPASSLCIALSDNAAVQRLNAGFRGKDKPTNVLSFPAGETATPVEGARPLGDIILALETVLAEASEQDKPAAHHFQHLVVHGALHLLGFDHETEGEASEMEALEIEILLSLGIPDPYAGTEVAA